LVEEGVEAVSARPEGIDLTHQREYRNSGVSADTESVRLGAAATYGGRCVWTA
jgi:hypothetical protein